jgi:plasmid stability protein
MSTLTIRNLDEAVKREIRKRAAEHGVSMEQEARTILRNATLHRPATEGTWRLQASREEILALGKPRSLDLKSLSDNMWDEGLL